jgi:peptide/nickel transport system permease protein
MLGQLKMPWWLLKKAPWVPILILGGFIFVSVFAEHIAPYSPTGIDLPQRLLPPGTEGHILGTDTLGRDLLTRLLYGGRVSLVVAAITVVVAGTIGLLVALVAGYLGGKVDAILMRTVDIFMSFPPILIAILFAVTLGPGMRTVIIAISVTYWSHFCRIIRAEVLQIKEQEYVALAKVAGRSPAYIMIRHILPNVLDTFLVVMSLQIGLVIRMESTLSFLGAGIAPPTPSWGQMVGAGKDYIDTAWWLAIIPGGALAAIVLSFNMLGDWIRDMMDPQLRAVMIADVERPWKVRLAQLYSRLRGQITAIFKNARV